LHEFAIEVLSELSKCIERSEWCDGSGGAFFEFLDHALLEVLGEMVAFDFAEFDFEEEAVAKGFEFGVIGDAVGGGDEDFGVDGDGLAVLVKAAFVEDAEEGVENRAVGAENFVDKGHFGGGEFALCASDILPFAKGFQVDGAEDFAWLGVACDEVVKEFALGEAEPFGERFDEGGFSGPWRSDEQQWFACYGSENEEFDSLISTDKFALQGAGQGSDLLACLSDGLSRSHDGAFPQ
jgi:hypothetical protein